MRREPDRGYSVSCTGKNILPNCQKLLRNLNFDDVTVKYQRSEIAQNGEL